MGVVQGRSGTSFDPSPQFWVDRVEGNPEPLTVVGRCFFGPIFGVPVDSPAARRHVIEYLAQHRGEIERRELWNYEVRVFAYTARADLLNMALFDEDVAYIAVSGHHPQKLSGVRVIGTEYATLLVSHFEQLLAGCKPLVDYLDDLEAGR